MCSQKLRRKEEKGMKKFVSLVLALLMVCTLFAGCGTTFFTQKNTKHEKGIAYALRLPLFA